MATIQITKVVAPSLWGWLGDRSGQRVRLVRLGAVVGAISFAGVFIEPEFFGLMLVMLVFTFFWNAILPLYEVITLRGLGSDKARYGRVRLWGSVGFIAAVAVVGTLLDFIPVASLPWLVMPVFLGIVVSSFMIPSEQGQVRERSGGESLRGILANPAVIGFFLMNFLLQVSHGAYYTFFSIHLEQYGYSSVSIGLLWSLGVLAEVVLFVAMHGLFARYSYRQIALAALALTLVRWVLIAEATQWLVVLLFAQLLHAASYGALHALSVQYIHGYFGKGHHGQGQALYSGLTFGAGGALGAWMSGFLVEGFNTDVAFWGSAMATLVALWVTWRWLRPPPSQDSSG